MYVTNYFHFFNMQSANCKLLLSGDKLVVGERFDTNLTGFAAGHVSVFIGDEGVLPSNCTVLFLGPSIDSVTGCPSFPSPSTALFTPVSIHLHRLF